MNNFSTTFSVPAIKYKSGNRIWYALTLNYKILPKFISNSLDSNKMVIPKEIQKKINNKSTVKQLQTYISKEEFFSITPVTVNSLDEIKFEAHILPDESVEEAHKRFEELGSIGGNVFLSLEQEFECLEGGNKIIAIENLLCENNESIMNSHLLLNIVCETNEEKIKQDFYDCNNIIKKNVNKKVDQSYSILLNNRNELTGITNQLLEKNKLLNGNVELFSTSISVNSNNVFTLNAVKNISVLLIGYAKLKEYEDMINAGSKPTNKLIEQIPLVFFEELSETEQAQQFLKHLNEKQALVARQIKYDNLLLTNTGITVAANVAAEFIHNNKVEDLNEMRKLFKQIFNIDWSRKNPLFEGNIIKNGGKVSHGTPSVERAFHAVNSLLGFV